MDDEELARLQELIDESERSTGERSPLRDVLAAQKAQRADLTNLLAPMPDSATAQVAEPESRLSPEPLDVPAPPPEAEEPESRLSPPREEPGLATPRPSSSPSEALQALLPEKEPVVKPAIEFGKQLVGGSLATIGRMPWDIAAQVTAAGSLLPGADDPAAVARRDQQLKEAAVWLTQQGVGADEALRGLLEIEPPKTTAGKVGAAMGKVPFFGPWGAAPTLAATGGVAAVQAGLDWLGSPGPNEMKLAPPPAVPPFSFVSTAYAKPGEPEFPTPGVDDTPEQYNAKIKEYEAALAAWQASGVPLAAKPPTPPTIGMPTGLTPTAARILNTVGGPQEISEADYRGMGYLGVATLGMALAPMTFGMLKFNKTPRMRSVKDTAPGTIAISTPGDLFRASDDLTQSLLNISKRAGVAPAELSEIETIHGIQGRNGSRALADSVVQTGRMDTPTYTFRAPTALAEMELRKSLQTDQYLILRDTQDQLNKMSQQPNFKPTQTNPNPGPPMIDGMTLRDVHQAMFAMEQAHPEVIPYSKAYNAHVEAVRKFEGAGEYATRPTKRTAREPHIEDRSLEYARTQRPNEVPFRGERDIGQPLAEREGPISSQAHDTRAAVMNRLNNEVVGMTIDKVRAALPGTFTQVTAEELAANPRWKKNTVSFYRRGVREYYTTDPFLADILKMDPWFLSGGWATSLYATKRLLEFGATGLGAPAFSAISLLRSWQISKYTAEKGFRSASLIGSLYAIPKQVLPQLAKAFSQSMEHGSGRWLNAVFPQGHLDALSTRLARAADQSLYMQLKQVGTARGSILEQQQASTAAMNRVNSTLQKAPYPFKVFWNGWKGFFESVHNGPAFDFVRKNLNVEPLPQLALRARKLTGDPRTVGQYYVKAGRGESTPKGELRPIRFESDNRVTHTAAQILHKGYGYPMQVMAESVPWFNATLQGAKRIGQAYLDNPIKFVGRMYMYAMAPAAGQYLYAFLGGKDPNGVSYVDYMLNRRSAYNRQMNWYVPIWGKPAEEGFEIPFFHEMAPFKRLMEIGMDHMLRTDRHRMDRTLAQEYWNAMHAFLDTAVIPPMPPILGAAAATRGIQLPQGVFGGEAYKRKDDPFDQTGGLPASIEMMARTMAGGIGHTLGQMYAAYSQTPEGFTNALVNASKAAGRVQVQRTPFLRDMLDMRPTSSGNTEVTQELFDKQKDIDRLNKYIQKWSMGGKFAGPGEINVNPASKGGGQTTNWLLGKGYTEQSPGLEQPPPTNPLYTEFMDQVQARFRKESPLPNRKGEDEGGIGFKSLWRRYGDSTEKLQRLKNVNEGNYVTWQRDLSRQPEAEKELTDAGVDPTNIRQVRNFYERKRHEAARIILYTIRAVENDFTNQLKSNPQLAMQLNWDGKPITLGKLDPYLKPKPQRFMEEVVDPTQFMFQDIVGGAPQEPQ